jgi:SAM-dependent methyltransferase
MTRIEANALRFDGLAEVYDANRPVPPVVLVDLLRRYAGVSRPALVVDLGCGTGLFSRQWIGRAEAVVGIEPSADMRRLAGEVTAGIPGGKCVSYRDGHSEATGLDAGCADIVVCSQSLHWMDPVPTFAEVGRILRSGGVFAAIDVDMTPSCGVAAEEAFMALRRRARALEEKLRLSLVRRWDKAGHMERMVASGRFRFTRQVMAHHVEPGGGDRLVGLALSMGGVASLLAHGVAESEFGLDALRREAAAMGPAPVPFHWSYVVRLGVK